MASKFLMTIYRSVLAPLAVLSAVLLSPFVPKLAATLRLRRQKTEWPDWLGKAPTLWVHCASGEFEYAKPLLREWRARHPAWKIFVTYYSPSFANAVRNHPDVDASAPLPLDLSGPMQTFVRRIQPKILAIARTDIWPEMVHTCRSLHIPVVLFSATRSPARFLPKLQQAISRARLGGLSAILCVSEQDKTDFNQLGLDVPVIVTGDTRYDQVSFRLSNPKPLKAQLKPPPGSPILVAGSTWPEDEDALLSASEVLLRNNKLRLILVPHEPHPAHLQQIQKRLQECKLSHVLYSQATHWDTEAVLIVDQVGLLAELYTWGDLALVGGSFRRSVHSVMEPLAAGLITIVGPHHHNNREALEFKTIPLGSSGFFMVEVARSASELQSLLTRLSDGQSLAPQDTRKSILREIQHRTGATLRVAHELETQLMGLI